MQRYVVSLVWLEHLINVHAEDVNASVVGMEHHSHVASVYGTR